MRYIARNFAYLEDDVLFNADGTATYGEIVGIAKYCRTNPTYLVTLGAGKTKPNFSDLKTAVAHGSVTASFTCEAFSTQRLQQVTPEEVKARMEELKTYTAFGA